ncbi:MAG: hypothetical protein C0190_05995 [Thermodesulfobacterium geofontis]|uniref:Calcium-binding protein n=1 Tax=Thermodesulfobacterium geofontis TaxID=1295609 RepID=A0A2N7PMH2_9BACT|nr:MAG: hypothetical protein C0190_05995 [Thermodesulfobacterium geofontis]
MYRQSLCRIYLKPISGSTGNDWLYGSNSDDVIFGKGGNDYLYGYDGDNVFVGGEGNDYMDGGAGSDVYVFRAGDGRIRFTIITGVMM